MSQDRSNRQPFAVTDTMDKYDIVCTVTGGGVTGQAGAIRHGLSRALLQASDEFRPLLKKEGFLTRDPRMKERKKYGLIARSEERRCNRSGWCNPSRYCKSSSSV